MGDADIGLIGLGVMGSNLALNIAEKGHRIAVFNRTPARTDAFVENAGALRDRIIPCHSIADLAAAIRPPRPIIMLVQAGKPVDEQIALLRRVLSPNATSSSTPAMPISATRCGASRSFRAAASPSSAWASPAARRARATARRSWSAARANPTRASRTC